MSRTYTIWILVGLLSGCSHEKAIDSSQQIDLGIRFLDEREPSTFSAEGKFEIKNTSRYPLSLVLLKKSCGCADCTIPDRSIAPGESATVAVRFGLSRKDELREEWVELSTDMPSCPMVRLMLRVEGLPRIAIYGERSSGEYSRYDCERLPLQVLAFFDVDEKDHEIQLLVDDESAVIEKEIAQLKVFPNGMTRVSQGFFVSMAKSPDANLSERQMKLIAQSAYASSSRTVEFIPRKLIESAPERVFLGRDCRIEKVTVRSQYPFRVTAVEVISEFSISVNRETESIARNNHVFELDVPLNISRTSRIGELILHTDLDDQPKITIPIYRF